jgi:hypothetical protein
LPSTSAPAGIATDDDDPPGAGVGAGVGEGDGDGDGAVDEEPPHAIAETRKAEAATRRNDDIEILRTELIGD